MEYMTTQQHVERIAESIGNGQHKQARNQFKAAIADYCTASALLTDNAEAAGLAANIIDNA